MANQRQKQLHQSTSSSGAGSKAPLLVLGVAALMIQGILVLPTAHAETATTTSTTINSIAINSDAQTSGGSGKVSFDLGVSHNLQTIASLSAGGSGPAGAGPQLWGGSSASSSFSPVNATIPAQKEKDHTAAVAVLKDASPALYRKIRLEEDSSANVAIPNVATKLINTSIITNKKHAGEAVGDAHSGELEPTVEDVLEQQVASTERETASRNTAPFDTSSSTTAAKPDALKNAPKDATGAEQEESLSTILNPVSLTTPATSESSSKNNDDDKKKKTSKSFSAAAAVVEEEKTNIKGKDSDVSDDTDGQTEEVVNETTDGAEVTPGVAGGSDTNTGASVEADDEAPRVGDQVVLDKDGNLVKDLTLKKDAKENVDAENNPPTITTTEDKIAKSIEETTTSNAEVPKPVKEEEQEEEETQPQQETVDDKDTGKKKKVAGPDTTDPADDKQENPGKEVNDDDTDGDESGDNEKEVVDKKSEESIDGVMTTDVSDSEAKKTTDHRKQAFADLREQILKQQEQEQQQESSLDDVEAPQEINLAAPTTPKPDDTEGTTDTFADTDNNTNSDGTTTLVRAPDFVPQEDMRAVIDHAKAEKAKKEASITTAATGGPLTPQQIADTEHQGANAFFELFAADVFPDVKLVGNNQLQDLDFEQRLNKLKEDKKSKSKAAAAASAATKKQAKKEKKKNNDKKKKSDKKKGKKQQQDDHDHHKNEKRAAVDFPEALTEKEKVHAALENIFGKDGAAKVEAEAGDSSADYKITVQGFNNDAAGTIDDDGDDDEIIEDQDFDEPIGILGAGKKDHHKNKHHHHKHHAQAVEGDATTVFSTGDEANKDNKNAKDTKDDKSSSSPFPASGGPPDRTAPGSIVNQPQQHQQPVSGSVPASPPSGAPPAGAKGAPAAVPAKSESKGAGTAGFGTVPMFGPAQLDFGNGAAALLPSSLASKGSLAFAFAVSIAWIVL